VEAVLEVAFLFQQQMAVAVVAQTHPFLELLVELV
jgi:hypothetical protein